MLLKRGGFFRLCNLFILFSHLCNFQVFAAFGIQKDASVEGVNTNGFEYNFFHYSSVAVFNGRDTSILGDDVLAGMAKKAWDEMRALAEAADQEGDMPNVMSALAVGDRVYFASSIKGGHGTPFFTHLPGMEQALTQTLLNCRPLLGIERRHRYDANCGEMMALYLYHQDRNAPPNPGPDQPKAVMVAVGIIDGVVTVWNACSPTSATVVGCRNILAGESWLRWVRNSGVLPSDSPLDPSSTYNLELIPC